MKVCFIDWFAFSLFNPDSNIVFGGAQIQLYFLAKELAKNKQNLISFLTDNRHDNRLDNYGQINVYQFVRSPKTPGLYGRFLNLLYHFPILSYLHFFTRLLFQLRKINAQIYFQRAASAETGLIALIARMLNRRFIFMVAHEQDVNGDYVKKNGWRGKLFWLGLILADKIACQTKDQLRQLPKNLKMKSRVILPAYPIEPLPRRKNINKHGILWVARAETWKNPELFLDLATRFPQEKFTMICPPAEDNPNFFLQIKAMAETVPNLRFINQVPFSKIDAYFSRAKVFISTSLSEGFPNTFIQAGIGKVPIISFKVNPDKIIDRHRLGFCADGDERQMEKLLKKILKNNQLRRQLAVNSYNYVRLHHDLNITKISNALMLKSA